MKTQMLSIDLYKILLFLFAGLISCSSDDLSDLNEVIYVRHANADIPAHIYGNGTSETFIILLHGGPGGSGLDYRIGSYSERLEERYAVVYFDQRGQGMAQGNYDKDEVTVELMAADVDALARVLHHKYGNDIRLFLLGHSWGGTLGSTVMVTENYQQQYNGWIEVSGAHDLPQTYRGAIRQFQTIGSEQIQLGNNMSFWESSLTRVNELDTNTVDFSYINKRAFEAEQKLNDDGFINDRDEENPFLPIKNLIFVNNIITTTIAGTTTAQQLVDNGLESYSVTDQLSSIQIPTLLIWGRYDLVVSPELGTTALNRIASLDKELVVFERSGHSPMITEPDRFVQVVSGFIDTH